MATLSIILTVFLLCLYLRERARNKSLDNEIRYIKERAAILSRMEEDGYILIPSANTGVKELAAELNRLLGNFYRQKAEYGRAKRAMEQVLANISHDLRTPLTVLKGCSELLSREMGQSLAMQNMRGSKDTGAAGNAGNRKNMQGMQEMAVKIGRKADELAGTMNAYFTMAKIESGDMHMDIKRENITGICHEAILDYFDLLEEMQYRVDIEISPMPVFASVDADALQRILKNLVDNALKHGGDGKYLGIRLKELSGMAVVEVEDHGKGIAGEELGQIFSRNYTTLHKGAGSGLGLAIARNLARQMGADIQVSSELGEKTVFTLVLKDTDAGVEGKMWTNIINLRNNCYKQIEIVPVNSSLKNTES